MRIPFVRALSRALDSAAFSTFVALLERAPDRQPDLLRVLTYHRVDHPGARAQLDPALVSATPDAFERQMQHVARRCHPVSMADVLEACEAGRALPPRSVLVTFDDAYADFAEHAWPLLKRLGVPVTLFVPTAFPDQPGRAFWWDRLHHAIAATDRSVLDTPLGSLRLPARSERGDAVRAIKARLKSMPHHEAMAWVDAIERAAGSDSAGDNSVLGWDALRRLAREGVTLGAHTRSHPLLHRVPPDQARAEVSGSLSDLRREIGRVPATLAYPGGGVSDAVLRTVSEAGVRLAFATSRGINDLRTANRLALERINVGRRTSQPLLRAQLLPWPTHWNRWRAWTAPPCGTRVS